MTACIDCEDDWVVVRGRCDTCYRIARREGVIVRLWCRVDEQEHARMVELQSRGMSLNGIAREIGRGVSTVHRHVGGVNRD